MGLPCAVLPMSLLLSLLLLLLGPQVLVTAPTNRMSQQSQELPGLMSTCGPGKYRSSGHCCQLCPAGEYVHEPCRRPHPRGQCRKCEGGTFTAFPNGLESCLVCSTCSEDQDMVAECTPTSNRICQCHRGQFYKAPGHNELCTRCSTCPKGSSVLQQCNSTADTVCGPPAAESRSRVVPLGSLIVVCLGIIYLVTKKPGDGGSQPTHGGLPNGVSVELEPLNEGSPDPGGTLIDTDVPQKHDPSVASPAPPAGGRGLQPSMCPHRESDLS